jgi:hypothetical protein
MKMNQRAIYASRLKTGLITAVSFCLILLFSLQCVPVSEQAATLSNSIMDAVNPGEFIVEPPTLICLGFEWSIEGDANRNTTVAVSYREVGAEGWRDALPLLRIGGEQADPEIMDYVTPHMFAGSIMDLQPDTEYECRFEIIDPDGVQGKSMKVVRARTRAVPPTEPTGRVRHVYPKDWTGSKEEPAYKGLLHAYYGYPRFADWNVTLDPVRPGDMILVHSGIYEADRWNYRDYHGLTFHGSYELTADGTEEQPIIIKAAGDGEVIFDGNGAYQLFNVMGADYNTLDGLIIRNADIGICAGRREIAGSTGLVVRNCRIEDVGIGIQAQYAGSKNFYIADNVIIGRANREYLMSVETASDGSRSQRVYSYYGVKVYGQGHVVCYNYVAYFYDGIDVCTHGGPETDPDLKSVSIDFYNNDIFLMNDNFIEADGGTHNIRILRNRGFNCAQAGFTNQPTLGGPIYWIRNIGYNVPNAMKWWDMPAMGVLVYHNTFTAAATRPDKGCSNVHFRNNLFVAPDESRFPVASLKTFTSYSSMDYNGYRLHPTKGPQFSWLAPDEDLHEYPLETSPKTFETLTEFQRATGQEQHAVLVDYDIFYNVPEPKHLDFNRRYKERGLDARPIFQTDSMDFRLKPDGVAVDAGCVLPNINDGYSGKAPDLGALETEQKPPHYGPRLP